MPKYRINNIYRTVQGEGVHTGVPMVLCRLQGCDVGCPFCDTKETWNLDDPNRRDAISEALGENELFTDVSAEDLVAYIEHIAGNLHWIMITGGEPALYDLSDLLESLHQAGYKTAIETSGTYPLQGCPTWVCVSPKADMPGGQSLEAATISRADELKFVIGKTSDIDDALSMLEDYETKPGVQICLQPLSLSRRATDLCLETVLTRGWRLSLQTHKFISIE
jgi:7-carboxy-7-deazaguanine synthase